MTPNTKTIREILDAARISSAKFAMKPRPAPKPSVASRSYRIEPTPTNIEFFKRFPA